MCKLKLIFRLIRMYNYSYLKFIGYEGAMNVYGLL